MAEERAEIESSDCSSYESAKRLLTGYLNKRMRISISDGRVIDGNFLCTDKDCNIVLSNCEEFLSQEEVDEYGSKKSDNRFTARQPRTLSLVIVPGEHISSILLAKNVGLSSSPAAAGPGVCEKTVEGATMENELLRRTEGECDLTKETDQTDSNHTTNSS